MTPTKSREERIAEWARHARESSRAGNDHLVLTCLNTAAVLAAEGEKTIAEILTEGVTP